MVEANQKKSAIRKQLAERLSAMTVQSRHAKSVAACALVAQTDEFRTARNIMLFLSMPRGSEHRAAGAAGVAIGEDGDCADGELGAAADIAGGDFHIANQHAGDRARACASRCRGSRCLPAPPDINLRLSLS